MATRMQQRRGTAAQWTSADPILASGEIGFESDTNQFKIGDGVNHWSDLSYFKNLEDLGGSLDDYILLTEKGNPDGVATLDGTGKIPSSQIPSLVGLDTEIATAVSAAVDGLVDSAPGLLNTLGEIAAAINNDENFANTVTTLYTQNSTNLTNHISDTSTHGVTGDIVGTNDSQTLTHKIIDGAMNTLSNIPQSAVTDLTTDLSTLTDDFTGLQTSTNNSFAGVNNDISALDGRLDTVESDITTINGNITTIEGNLDLTNDAVALKAPIASPTFTGTVGGITKGMVGLGNVDNTSDADKPVSTATQSALDLKANASDITELSQDAVNSALTAGTGITKAYDDSANTITIAVDSTIATRVYADDVVSTHASDTSTHGVSEIVGTSESQTLTNKIISAADNTVTINAADIIDVTSSAAELNILDGATLSTTELNYVDGVTSAIQTQLDSKAPVASPTFTGTVSGITKSMVGLGNVDNTSDANKPVSTATQSALDLKAPLASPTFTGTVTLPTGTVTSEMILDGTIVDGDISSSAAIAKTKISGTAITAADTGTITSTMIADGTIVNADINASAAIAQSKVANLTSDLALKAPLASPTFTGTVNAEALTLSGNLTVQGTTTTVSSQNLELTDSLIYLASQQYTTDAVDVGIYAAYGTSSNSSSDHPHTGLVRDASDGKWKLISGGAEPVSNIVDFSTVTKDTLVIGALDATSATIGNVSNTELQYLDGVTSAIQTQINAKAPSASPTFTGTVTLPDGTVTSAMILDGTIVNADINASAAIAQSKIANLTTDLAAKAPSASPTFTGTVVLPTGTSIGSVTSTELGYVSGVTSAIQTQLDAKTPELYTFTTDSGTSRTLSLTDKFKSLKFTSATAVAVSVPTNASVALPIGSYVELYQWGAGQITVSAVTPATTNIRSTDSQTKSRTQYSAMLLVKVDTDEWLLTGDLTA